ncbi:MAG TPA: cell division protein ZapE [Steroidobacteraceae bacterium]|jgi:cell division protein ZapE|nr:cell division protein ZapE [Steroidobacteraceae bacterium]
MSLHARYAQELARCGFHADPAQQAAVAALEALRERLIERHSARSRRWFAQLRAPQMVRGLYLWGGVGRGKTFLMDLFFESLPFAARQRRHFHRFMQEVHAQLRGLPQTAAPLEELARRTAREAHMLCLDELFVSDIADAMLVGGLLRALFRRGVTLVATSNLPPGRLYDGGLQRARFLPAIELLERNTHVLEVDAGTDYRLRDLTSAGIYFASSAPATQVHLAALFDRLAAGREAHTGTVQIEGRPIAVVRESGTAIWCDFAALCTGPRSQNDYIEIARAYQAVFLSNVPQLDADHENEARRFIALVDELYDHAVKLIMSAAAQPAQLYSGERLAGEFARAASRLTEMQTRAYLAREHRP